jgi:hypothetical protein
LDWKTTMGKVTGMARTARRGTALSAALVLLTLSFAALGQPSNPKVAGSSPAWSDAVVLELAEGFVPVANDIPLMAGAGLRFGDVHEIWARAGYMPIGDDVGHGFGCAGYRAALRPHKIVRPVLGGLFAGLPATCGHDAMGRPSCTSTPLFILAATGGVRIEPVPWLGLSAVILLGVDSYPNPFGMIEIAQTFALPLS